VVQPGTDLGPLLPHIAEEVQLGGAVPVIAPACHDTGSAVAAVPVSAADQANFAYLSSGTWSLMGVELSAPVINDKSLVYNVTNEGGVQNTIRLLKNLAGLWPVQECRRVWALQGEEYSFAVLTGMASEALPFAVLVDLDDPLFMAPGDMEVRIGEYCHRTGQTPPAGKGGIIRVLLEGLALKYRWLLERLEDLIGRRIEVIHIVGGGTQNKLLNQFAANATGRRVVAGPVEATSIGNILMQMLAVGQIGSLNEGRELIKRSFPVETYEPQDTEKWQEVYARFIEMIG
jgi:rhamnulokinase